MYTVSFICTVFWNVRLSLILNHLNIIGYENHLLWNTKGLYLCSFEGSILSVYYLNSIIKILYIYKDIVLGILFLIPLYSIIPIILYPNITPWILRTKVNWIPVSAWIHLCYVVSTLCYQ